MSKRQARLIEEHYRAAQVGSLMLAPAHPLVIRRKSLRARERAHAAALLRQLRLPHRDTAAHSLRVARLAAWIGGEALYLSALMHDDGKLMVPARLLAAPRSLDGVVGSC